MGIDVSQTELRGLVVPTQLSTADLWTAQSTYTEQDVVAGTATASAGAKLVVETTGTQTSDIDLKSTSAGTPGRGAGFVWKKSTDTNYYGLLSGNAISDFSYFGMGSGANTYTQPSGVALSSGEVLAAYLENTTTRHGIVLKRRGSQESTFATTLLVWDNGVSGAGGIGAYPALCEMPDGSVLLAHWISYPALSTTTKQIYIHRSTDKGQTWTLVSRAALDIGVDSTVYTIGKLHLASHGGQVLLLGSCTNSTLTTTVTSCVLQAASTNQGVSFSTISTIQANEGFYKLSLLTTSQGFAITWISDVNKAEFYTLPHAFYPISGTISGTGGASTITSETIATRSGGPPATYTAGDHCSWVDDDENIYAIFRRIGATANNSDGAWWLTISEDGGSSWQLAGDASSITGSKKANIYNTNDQLTSLKNPHCVAGQGRFWILTTFDANPGTTDNSVAYIVLGGYSSLTLPARADDAKIYQRFGWSYNFLPFELPADTPVWTKSGGGTEALTGLGLQLDSTSSAGNHISYSHTSATMEPVKGCIVRMMVVSVLGGDVSTTTQRGVELKLDDASKNYELDIRVGMSDIRVMDRLAGTQLGIVSPGSVLQTQGVELVAAVADGKGSVWYRAADHTAGKGWIAIVNGATLTNGGGSGSNEIKFGHVGVASGNMTSYIREFHVAYFPGLLSGSLADGFANPGDLQPINYPYFGNYTYLDEGLLITTKDGPAYEGDTYAIKTRSQYGIERIFHSTSPSPQSGWRSVAVSSGAVPEQFIPLLVDPNGQEIKFQSDLVALHLENINWRTASLEGYDVGTGSWVVIGSIDTSIGILTSTYERAGKTIYGASGASQKPYFFHHEANGWYVELSGTTIRKIHTNSEGSWSGSGGSRAAIIQLDGVEAGDPTSGAIKFMPSVLTVVASLNNATYSAIGLRISSQSTATKDIRIGHFSFGAVHVLSPQYGRGRSISYEANTEEFEQPDGIIRSRKRGIGRRTTQISWSEPVDTSPFFPHEANVSPDYVMATNTAGAPAVANYGDVPLNLMGMVRHLAGGARPVVYLPHIAKATNPSGDFRLMRRRDAHLLAYIGNDITIDNVVGDELMGDNTGEAFRVATITLTEVI